MSDDERKPVSPTGQNGDTAGEEKDAMARLKWVMETLLSENGCPWDKVQTHDTLKPYLLEECYEVVDAIDAHDDASLCEELGDVLFQVVFHAQLAQNRGAFTLEDVARQVCDKMISRHTHIFGKDKANTPEEVMQYWDKAKKQEKGYQSTTDAMRRVTRALPATLRAEKVQKLAAKKGYGYTDVSEALQDMLEMAQKLAKASDSQMRPQILELYGNLSFALAAISRFLEINAEFALTNATETYINRFERYENMPDSAGKVLEQMDSADNRIF